MSTDRVPNSLEAEQNLIACILIDPDCLPVVRERVRPVDFFNDNARIAYQACLAVKECNQATVHYELDRQGYRMGRDYLSNLISGIVKNVSLEPETYANIIRVAAYNRQVIQLAGELSRLGYTGNATPLQVSELIESFLDGQTTPKNNQYRGIRRA